MAVKVGSARHDEKKRGKGGQAGDQTGLEVSRQNWYLHRKGWVLIRPKSATVREKVAEDMEFACDNPNIGYDRHQSLTLYNVVKKLGYDCSKVTTPCETHCSRLVRVCLLYAGLKVPTFYTGDMIKVLQKTGYFDILTDDKYTKSKDYLLRGDILCTKTTGHTVVVLNDGPKAKKTVKKHLTVKRGSRGTTVKELQLTLNAYGYTDNEDKPLVLDGKFGPRTDAALRKLQRANKLKVDGICGPITWECIDSKTCKKNTKALKD